MLKVLGDLITMVFSIPVLITILYLITLFKVNPNKGKINFYKICSFEFDKKTDSNNEEEENDNEVKHDDKEKEN